ncbi:type I-E CRISPR-associated endoribonuclease Cas2 (plasmid) [Vibrio azureus]|uniref:Putative CRISPR-associated protein n=1 Tax=Vibrio azureus NBRC 104587 TaxID=1219077 RepID=U3ACX6_9VIBR|nr:type I-E CRISPR-associated endoribonuclease Cas2e [Vibrio azureus]AUI88994.1 type I-E CRISPR-associated endoribonuclease Cas2 [Vibrio azureus]GAD77776.1 putative CRISPR-associated protein [Vibrio azureus NBRC 104587]
MLVVIANDLPPAVRGRMKLWFVEAKPNVFVSGLKDSVANKVVDYLFQHCPSQAGLTIFKSINKPPGYEIRTLGETKRSLINLSGLFLVSEKTVS